MKNIAKKKTLAFFMLFFLLFLHLSAVEVLMPKVNAASLQPTESVVIAASNSSNGSVKKNIPAKEYSGKVVQTTIKSSDSTENTAKEETHKYILDKSTHKFHLENCSLVGKISKNNKEEVTDTLTNLEDQGYSPCSTCKPEANSQGSGNKSSSNSSGSIEDQKEYVMTPKSTESSSEKSDEHTFILNTNSHKFHVPICEYADQINSANRKEVVATAASIINDGYIPCSYCSPQTFYASKMDESGSDTITADNNSSSNNSSSSDENKENSSASDETGSTSDTETSDGTESYKYVLNTNTKKVHLPSCEHVDDIADGNKQYSNGPLSELLEAGYTECKDCNPGTAASTEQTSTSTGTSVSTATEPEGSSSSTTQNPTTGLLQLNPLKLAAVCIGIVLILTLVVYRKNKKDQKYW